MQTPTQLTSDSYHFNTICPNCANDLNVFSADRLHWTPFGKPNSIDSTGGATDASKQQRRNRPSLSRFSRYRDRVRYRSKLRALALGRRGIAYAHASATHIRTVYGGTSVKGVRIWAPIVFVYRDQHVTVLAFVAILLDSRRKEGRRAGC